MTKRRTNPSTALGTDRRKESESAKAEAQLETQAETGA